MMSFTTFEKKELLKHSEEKIINDSSNILYLKLFYNFLENHALGENLNLTWGQLSENTLKDDEKVKKILKDIFEQLANIATTNEIDQITYTTGDLAKYFCVSITTINNWIKEGRFIGVKRQKENEQIRISESTQYRNRGGKIFTVAEVVKMYEKEQDELNALQNSDQNLDEFTFLVHQCAQYEEKYGGEYHRTLGFRDIENMTPEERTDATTWNYFVKRLNVVTRGN